VKKLLIFIIVLALLLLFVAPGAFAAINGYELGYGCYNWGNNIENVLGGPSGWGCW